MRAIDADALLARFERDEHADFYGGEYVRKAIAEAPSIDVTLEAKYSLPVGFVEENYWVPEALFDLLIRQYKPEIIENMELTSTEDGKRRRFAATLRVVKRGDNDETD